MGADVLEERVENIADVLDTENVLRTGTDAGDIRRYYAVNMLPYRFHSPGGFVHMGLSDDGTFDADDLKKQAQFVADYIEEEEADQVLELAMGRGANSAYLAERYPAVQFCGIDLTEKHVKKATKRAKRYDNFAPRHGDFHDLSRFETDRFDVVFIVEALCYADDKGKVLAEVSRVLKPGGVFIVFDGYTRTSRDELSATERRAQALMERGMAVEEFEPYETFREAVKQSSFDIVYEEDASERVLPTLRRFERWADRFFRHPRIARVLAAVLPDAFVYNAVSGALLAPLVEEEVATYQITVLQNSA